MIDEDEFYDFCNECNAPEEFISGLHYWLDQFEFKKMKQKHTREK